MLPVPDRLRKNLKRGATHVLCDRGDSDIFVRLPGGGPGPAGMVLSQGNGNPAIFKELKICLSKPG
jgi:hypothetical protein